MRKEVPLQEATRLLNHGPVVLVTSLDGEKVGITPVAWHMPVNRKPPQIVLEISEGHFIYDCIMKTGDFVVNIPSMKYAEQVVRCGSVSGRDVDKVKTSGFTPQASREVKSPSLKEAIAVLECVLIRDEHLLKEYNMVPGAVKYAGAEEGAFDGHWLFRSDGLKTLHHLGNKTFCVPDGRIIDLRQEKE